MSWLGNIILLAVSRILDLAFYPGMVIQLVFTQVVCRRLDVAVDELCYLRAGLPPAYIRYPVPRRVARHLALVLVPLLASVCLGGLLLAPGMLMLLAEFSPQPSEWVGLYFGVAICYHALPAGAYEGVPLQGAVRLLVGGFLCLPVAFLLWAVAA